MTFPVPPVASPVSAADYIDGVQVTVIDANYNPVVTPVALHLIRLALPEGAMPADRAAERAAFDGDYLISLRRDLWTAAQVAHESEWWVRDGGRDYYVILVANAR